jgi:hypothetical protein
MSQAHGGFDIAPQSKRFDRGAINNGATYAERKATMPYRSIAESAESVRR